MKTEILAIRHGETKSNLSDILDGQLGGALTPYGESQIKQTAKKLRLENIDVIYTSTLKRAKQSSKIIEKELKKKAIFEKLLIERNLGKYQGRKGIEWHKARLKSKQRRELFKPKGTESFLDVVKRATIFAEKIKQKNKGKRILVITHDAVIKALFAALYKKKISDAMKMKIRNATVYKIRI